MSGNQTVTVGDKGRVVLPADLRDRYGFHPGTDLIALETDDGLLLLTRSQLLRRIRADFADVGGSLVDELMAERRAAAADEDRTEAPTR